MSFRSISSLSLVSNVVRTAVLTLLLLASAIAAEVRLGSDDFVPSRASPVGWRGDGSGLTQGLWPGATPPRQWGFSRRAEVSADSKPTGLQWSVICPNQTLASPIVVADKVITLADPQTVLAYDSSSGELLWYNAADQLDIIPDLSKEEAHELRRLWLIVDALFEKYNLAPGAKPKRGQTQEQADAKALRRFESSTGFTYEEAYAILERHGIGRPQGNGLYGPKGLPKSWKKRFHDLGLWQRGYSTMGHTEATPVSDGKWVWVSYVTNTVTCYAVDDGTTRWSRFFGGRPDASIEAQTGEGEKHLGRWPASKYYPSPLLLDGVLLIQHGHYLRGLDPDSGETRWEHPYCKPYYGTATPVTMRLDGTSVLITGKGAVYRVSDGQLLKERISSDFKSRSLGGSSPFTDGNDIVFFYDGSTGGGRGATGKIYAYRLSMDGSDAVSSELLWSGGASASEGTGLCVNGLVYANGFATKGGIFRADTGEPVSLGNSHIKQGGRFGSVHLAGDQIVDWDGVSQAGRFQLGQNGTLKPIDASRLKCAFFFGDPHGRVDHVHKDFESTWVRTRLEAWRSGLIGWFDPCYHFGGEAYGNGLWFQGSDVYVRTRTHLYKFGTDG